jgi:hypothetical protein
MLDSELMPQPYPPDIYNLDEKGVAPDGEEPLYMFSSKVFK